MKNTKPIILDFEKQTLNEAIEGKSTLVLINLADISNIIEWAPISDKLPNGMSLIELRRGQQFPIKGTPAVIKARIDAALSAS